MTSQEARNNNPRTSSAETVVIAQLYRNKLYHLPIIMVDKSIEGVKYKFGKIVDIRTNRQEAIDRGSGWV